MSAKIKLLFLTATLPRSEISTVKLVLGLQSDTKTIIRTPYKPNIFYCIDKIPAANSDIAHNLPKILGPLVSDLRIKGINTPRVVIFCRSYELINEVFCYLVEELGDALYHPSSATVAQNRLIAMYTGINYPYDTKMTCSSIQYV